MITQSLKQDVIANNIANAQTPGFRRQRVVSASFYDTLRNSTATLLDKQKPPYPDSTAQTVVVNAEEGVDTSQGPVHQTDNPCNFAIDGPGAFEVGTGASTRQTRNGSFVIDKDGELATTDGEKVMGRSGPIRIPKGSWSVNSTGAVISNGAVVDQIKIVGGDPAKTQVMQGYIEDSNVNIIREMVDMIANVRSFEANQKVVTDIDHTLDKLINEAGKV